MLTTAALLLCLVGIALSLIQLVHVQPKRFSDELTAVRADMRSETRMLADKFDAQLTAVRMLAENAKATLDTAAEFFSKSEHRFNDIDQWRSLYEHRLCILEEQTKAIGKLIDEHAKLKGRVSSLEIVCARTHEHSLVSAREELGLDTDGVPEPVGHCRRKDR